MGYCSNCLKEIENTGYCNECKKAYNKNYYSNIDKEKKRDYYKKNRLRLIKYQQERRNKKAQNTK